MSSKPFGKKILPTDHLHGFPNFGVLTFFNYALNSKSAHDTYGEMSQTSGTSQTVFGYTGEETDANGLVNLRARYYNPTIGQFFGLDPLETPNRYAYVDGNPINMVDPSGKLFWSFPPGRGGKTNLYSPSEYMINPSGTCRKVFGHVWIDRWMEQNNGFWETQVEFPGGGGVQKIDTVVFDGPFSNGSFVNLDYGTTGFVYEIEPVEPLVKVSEGYLEVQAKFAAMSMGTSPFTHTGNLPTQDFFNPARDMGKLSGAAYDWTKVSWSLGKRLSYGAGRGPVRVDPNQLGGTGIPDAYWIWLPTDGLIIFVSECELRQNVKDLTTIAAEDALSYLLKRWRDSQSRASEGRPSYVPLPEPQLATSTASVGSSSSDPSKALSTCLAGVGVAAGSVATAGIIESIIDALPALLLALL